MVNFSITLFNYFLFYYFNELLIIFIMNFIVYKYHAQWGRGIGPNPQLQKI